MNQQFEFTLPVTQKKLTWRMLSVKQQLDTSVLYRADAQKVYLNTALYGARIIACDDKQYPAGMPLAEIGSWNEVDYTAFTEHVDSMEADQHRAFRKRQQNEVSPAVYLEKAIMDYRLALTGLDKAMSDALEAVKISEAQAASPLK